ncbi:MAG TPA: HD domain-containing phosphohydrolase [Bacteriovoracaceae bacterium]|nr:HD domain-containing phosphohydrolase [Bacteriovoracaceae bacterium]
MASPITGINSYIEQHRLTLKLKSVSVGELHLARKLRHPVYVFKNGIFFPVITQGSSPTKEQIHTLIKHNHREVFIFNDDLQDIKKSLEQALLKVTRSLSVGDPLTNGTKDIKLLTLNLGGLYQNPHSDELLMLQFQSTQNLSKFLCENKKLQPQLYQNLLSENFHYTLSHPMLSSILLLSFLQATRLFHEKEVENLFLASYLKDIGFSMIPADKYDLKTLTTRDQELFADHADFSFELLEGRIPLAKNYLHIIKHHHFMNDKMKGLLSKDPRDQMKEPDMIFGLESTLVAVFDILVAMTADRPYREGKSWFQSLDLIKKMMADDYPQEFKALVIFLKNFYKF